MSKDLRKINPDDNEDENHNNTPRRTTLPTGVMNYLGLEQDLEESSDTSEAEMNSEEAMEALGESLGLIKPQTDLISAPQGATAMPQPQFIEQDGGNNTFGFVNLNLSDVTKIFL